MSASHRALLLLICCLGSGVAALLLAADADERASAAGAAQAEARQLDALAMKLASELAGDPTVMPARNAASRATQVLALMRAADDRHGVRWTALAFDGPPAPSAVAGSATSGVAAGAASASGAALPAGLSVAPLPAATTPSARALDMLFAPLRDAPGMAAARLSASGDYRSLSGLQALLEALADEGVALTSISIDDNRVSLSAAVLNRRP